VTVGVVTLGCDKNTVDTERYRAELAANGASLTRDLSAANVIIVNTCGFIDAAKKESIDALVNAGTYKESGSCRAVVAVGCMVERHRAELEAVLPEVDLFLGTSDAGQLVSSLADRGWLAPSRVVVHPGVRVYDGDLPHVRYLKISEGCDHGCAFCAIPLMRGRHRSFALADVVREAQLLELQGAREINLVAQDLAHYGRDRRDGTGLADVLGALVAETSVPWIRLLYLYSAGLTDRTLDLLAREPRLVKYLDMPIQHGSDAVLQRMRRPERAASIRTTVGRVRRVVPEVALRTTCIVGFPGETEDDFQRLLDLLEETQFERVGFFTYSAQAGTRANEMVDDVPDTIKFERIERATEHQRLITGDRYETRVGTIAHAIIDRPADGPDADVPWASGGARSRLSWQADDIDGITYLDRHDLPPGTIAEVRVDGVVDDYDFRATVCRVVSPAVTGATLAGPGSGAGGRGRRQLPLAAAGATGGGTSPSSVGSFGR
jgi:ribosomal protein S12 methylthiotransferase